MKKLILAPIALSLALGFSGISMASTYELDDYDVAAVHNAKDKGPVSIQEEIDIQGADDYDVAMVLRAKDKPGAISEKEFFDIFFAEDDFTL